MNISNSALADRLAPDNVALDRDRLWSTICPLKTRIARSLFVNEVIQNEHRYIVRFYTKRAVHDHAESIDKFTG
jgi:hypothetical protein